MLIKMYGYRIILFELINFPVNPKNNNKLHSRDKACLVSAILLQNIITEKLFHF